MTGQGSGFSKGASLRLDIMQVDLFAPLRMAVQHCRKQFAVAQHHGPIGKPLKNFPIVRDDYHGDLLRGENGEHPFQMLFIQRICRLIEKQYLRLHGQNGGERTSRFSPPER